MTSIIKPNPRRLQFSVGLLSAILLAACSSTPPPPAWQANAFTALNGFSAAYLRGNTRLADFEFARAKTEIASTGRADLLARAELIRCATRVASLEFDNCAAYLPLAQDASASEQAYAAFLSGNWTGLDPARLPEQHRALVSRASANKQSGNANSFLGDTQDPLARLIAAGVLLQTGQLAPSDITVAIDTASARGWRRPLLAWLGLQLKRTNDAGNVDAKIRIQRRIDLVLQADMKSQ